MGLKAFVTLHHFTAPAWFQEKGSFEKKANIKHFEDYVRHCCRAFGDLVDAWITINEPYIYLSQSYLIGAWPPQKKSWLATLKVLPNLAQAHKKAYQIIRQEAKGTQVGMAKNLIAFKPLTKNPADKLFCQLLDFVYNHSFYRLTGDSHDFIGINYYTCGYISWKNIGMISYFDEERVKRVIEAAPKHEENDLGWQIYPKGLYELALSLSRKHQKPIYITENGLADKKDRRRSQFLKDHLEWIWRAIAKGADIRGYFHWTLMDNFEWSLGYGPKFGLFKTDFKTQKRVPRPSAKLYAKICQQNALEL